MRTLINDPKFARSQTYFELACSASRTHSIEAQEAFATYGDHGPQVSGCIRDHFPEPVKKDLRFWAREVTRFSGLAYAYKPKRVRFATMRQLAREIATRDGSGFYGPQPNA